MHSYFSVGKFVVQMETRDHHILIEQNIFFKLIRFECGHVRSTNTIEMLFTSGES